MKTIREAFNHHFGKLKIDNNFVREVEAYLKAILTKNEDSINFFGSPLVGVYRVYFDKGDFNYLWGILVEEDQDEVRGSLHSLPYIKPHWKVGGDETNQLLFYLLHRVMTSTLPEKTKFSTAVSLLVITQYKHITALLWRDYPHLVDRELALTVYNKLSRRFILRQVDSWREFMFNQANDMLLGTDKRKDMMSIIMKYNDDKLITDTVTGIRDNLNGMFVEYNAVFHRVKDESDRITLDSSLGTNSEGESTFKDNLTNPARYSMYLESTISKRDTFMDDELMKMISTASKSRYKPLRKALVHISENYGERRQEHIREFVNNTLMFGLEKLRDGEKNLNNIREVFDLLSGSFSSSRSLDPTLEMLKEFGGRIVMDSAGGKLHNNTLTLTRTTVMVYLVIFTLVKS